MTSTKRKKSYTREFKEETVAFVTEQGFSVIDAASAVGVQPNQIYNWKKRIADETSGIRLTGEEVKKLKIEKEILKKASAYFCEGNEVKFKAIAKWAEHDPIVDLCEVLRVTPSAYYHWRRKPAKLITEKK